MRPRDPLSFLADELRELEHRDRLRVPPSPRDLDPPDRLNLCSNDYLGYARSGVLLRRVGDAIACGGVWSGAGASRLVCGEHALHRALEASLAQWLRTEGSLVFSSASAANLGVIGALARRGDLIVSDALNHASIVDGCRLSRADVRIVPHLSVDAIEDALRQSAHPRRWVVVESCFSMDGDVPDLVRLRRVCDEHGAGLIVDEAHAIGLYGPEGRGLCAEVGIVPDALVGAFGKALGGQGGFIAGRGDLCRWLWNRARSFVYSTGVSPLLCVVGLAAVERVRTDDPGRAALWKVAAELARIGRVPVAMRTPIVAKVLGSERDALEGASRLRYRGIDVLAIRPPTVPEGTSRLRITANALLTSTELEKIDDAFAQCFT